eukprot:SAG22_NODE_975_length_6203_cov_25.423001_1_plen_94_part_00
MKDAPTSPSAGSALAGCLGMWGGLGCTPGASTALRAIFAAERCAANACASPSTLLNISRVGGLGDRSCIAATPGHLTVVARGKIAEQGFDGRT